MQQQVHRHHSQEHGPCSFAGAVACAAKDNTNFRTAYWTGGHLQLTLMCIPVGNDIGSEVHPDTDQYIRVEEGCALVRLGKCRDKMDNEQRLGVGDAVFVAAGTWHNVINNGSCPLKLSSVYAPPHHPAGTVERTKADAE